MGFEDRDRVAEEPQIARRRETRGAAADDRDPLPGRFAGLEEVDTALHHVVDGVALQIADANRRVILLIDARALAEFFGRADPRATRAHRIGLEDDARAAFEVSGRDLSDERRDVDVRRTRPHAGRVVAIQAAVRFEPDFKVG